MERMAVGWAQLLVKARHHHSMPQAAGRVQAERQHGHGAARAGMGGAVSPWRAC